MSTENERGALRNLGIKNPDENTQISKISADLFRCFLSSLVIIFYCYSENYI